MVVAVDGCSETAIDVVITGATVTAGMAVVQTGMSSAAVAVGAVDVSGVTSGTVVVVDAGGITVVVAVDGCSDTVVDVVTNSASTVTAGMAVVQTGVSSAAVAVRAVEAHMVIQARRVTYKEAVPLTVLPTCRQQE